MWHASSHTANAAARPLSRERPHRTPCSLLIRANLIGVGVCSREQQQCRRLPRSSVCAPWRRGAVALCVCTQFFVRTTPHLNWAWKNLTLWIGHVCVQVQVPATKWRAPEYYSTLTLPPSALGHVSQALPPVAAVACACVPCVRVYCSTRNLQLCIYAYACNVWQWFVCGKSSSPRVFGLFL